jgi:hypothetical protein
MHFDGLARYYLCNASTWTVPVRITVYSFVASTNITSTYSYSTVQYSTVGSLFLLVLPRTPVLQGLWFVPQLKVVFGGYVVPFPSVHAFTHSFIRIRKSVSHIILPFASVDQQATSNPSHISLLGSSSLLTHSIASLLD